MTIKYYAWKDGKKTEKKQEWREITQDEFIKICSSNRQNKPADRRYFYQLPELEVGDYYLYLECTYEQYKISRAERYERIKKIKEMEELEKERQLYKIVSLDSTIEDSSGGTCSLHSLIPDNDSMFEDRLIIAMDIHAAIKTLTPEELNIVEMLYLSEYAVSERELARQMGVPQKTMNYKKIKILKKLKKYWLTSTDFWPLKK